MRLERLRIITETKPAWIRWRLRNSGMRICYNTNERQGKAGQRRVQAGNITIFWHWIISPLPRGRDWKWRQVWDFTPFLLLKTGTHLCSPLLLKIWRNIGFAATPHDVYRMRVCILRQNFGLKICTQRAPAWHTTFWQEVCNKLLWCIPTHLSIILTFFFWRRTQASHAMATSYWLMVQTDYKEKKVLCWTHKG